INQDWVSIVDSAWHNYYHFLTLAIPRLYLAQCHCPDALAVLPARLPPRPPWQVAPALLDRMIELTSKGNPVKRIEDGVYRVRNLYLIWVNHVLPTYQHLCDETFGAFAAMAKHVSPSPGVWPEKIFIARPHKPRIEDPDAVRTINQQLKIWDFQNIQ